MKRALERQVKGKAYVIPIILRPCDWRSAPFGKQWALPMNGVSLSRWTDRDEAYTEIATTIRGAVDKRILTVAIGEEERAMSPGANKRLSRRRTPGALALIYIAGAGVATTCVIKWLPGKSGANLGSGGDPENLRATDGEPNSSSTPTLFGSPYRGKLRDADTHAPIVGATIRADAVSCTTKTMTSGAFALYCDNLDGSGTNDISVSIARDGANETDDCHGVRLRSGSWTYVEVGSSGCTVSETDHVYMPPVPSLRRPRGHGHGHGHGDPEH